MCLALYAWSSGQADVGLMADSGACTVAAQGSVLLEGDFGYPASGCEVTQYDEGSVGYRDGYHLATATTEERWVPGRAVGSLCDVEVEVHATQFSVLAGRGQQGRKRIGYVANIPPARHGTPCQSERAGSNGELRRNPSLRQAGLRFHSQDLLDSSPEGTMRTGSREAPNRLDADQRANPCSPDKIEPMKQALRHFGMI